MNKLIEISNKLPQDPGVYIFRNSSGDILYIGKATSLRDRVRSYLAKDLHETRGPLIVKLMTEVVNITFEKTDSVLEALILEAHLIKKHLPLFNTKEKDNKSFNHVVLTDEDFPQLLVIRGRELDEKLTTQNLQLKALFGPFPHGGELKEALKIIRRIFPWRDFKCKPNQGRPCFNAQIGLCPGVCTGVISKKEYAKIIKNITLFFEGNKKKILKNLEKEMKSVAKIQEFEKAETIRRQIFALNHIQDVALIKHKENAKSQGVRIESFDIAHMSGTSVVGVMTVVEDGEIKKSDYRKFNIKQNPGVDDTRALKEVLARRFNHSEWRMPDIVVVDGGIAQKNAAENILKELNLQIPVMAVTKDERHRPREIQGDQTLAEIHKKEILLSNAEAHRFAISFHRQKRDIVS